MIDKVSHIGIAVEDLESAVAVYRDALGLELAGYEDVEDDGIRVAMMKGGDDVVELMEATKDTSPIKRFIEKRGPGIHHLCFQVEDVQATLDRCRERGMRLIDESPRPGAGGCLVAFVHPKSTGGVLIELSQRGTGHD